MCTAACDESPTFARGERLHHSEHLLNDNRLLMAVAGPCGKATFKSTSCFSSDRDAVLESWPEPPVAIVGTHVVALRNCRRQPQLGLIL